MAKAAQAVRKAELRPHVATPEHAPQRGFAWWWLVLAVVVVEAALELYGPSMRGPFVFDDFSLPFYDPHRVVDDVTQWIRGVRPILMFSYWLNFHFAGRDPFSYHIVNVLVHTANAALVFAIAMRLLDRERRWVAGLCGLLFLVHPVQTESVAYIAGRSESLSALWVLAALAAFVYAPGRGISWRRSLAILFFFVLAVGTKEHAAVLPAVFLLTDWIRNPFCWRETLRRNARLYIPLLAGALAASGFVWKVLSASHSAGFALAGVTWYGYFFTQCAVLPTYLRLAVLPLRQSLDYNVPILSAPDLMTFVGLAVIAGLGWVAWKCRTQHRTVTLGILLFFVFLAPTSSFIPIKDPIAERRMYLPLFGLLLAGSAWVPDVKRHGSKLFLAATGLPVIFGVLTYQRSAVWSSEARLWEDAIASDPANVRAYPHLIHGYVSEHRCGEALRRLDDVSKQISVGSELLVHWAFAYECVNRLDEAVSKLEKAAAMNPDANVLMKIAVDRLRMNQVEDAMSALNRALSLDPTFEPAYVTRGDLYARAGEIPQALDDYRHALRTNPRNARARYMLESLSALRR